MEGGDRLGLVLTCWFLLANVDINCCVLCSLFFVLFFFVFSVNLVLLLDIYLVQSIVWYGVHFFWGVFELHVLLDEFNVVFLELFSWFGYWQWMCFFVWCRALVWSRGVLDFWVPFALVDAMLESVNFWGSIRLCGISWFVLVVDGFKLYVVKYFDVFVGGLGLDVVCFFLLFTSCLCSVILNENINLVLVSVF